MPWTKKFGTSCLISLCGLIALPACAETPDYGAEAPSLDAVTSVCTAGRDELGGMLPDTEVSETEFIGSGNTWSTGSRVACSYMATPVDADIPGYAAFSLILTTFKDGESDSSGSEPAGPGCGDLQAEGLREIELSGVVACMSGDVDDDAPNALFNFTVDHVDVLLSVGVDYPVDAESTATALAAFVIDEIRAA